MPKLALDLDADELIVDSFAGGGGASLGISWAAGRFADLAVNHDSDALAMFAANHPGARTMLEDVWQINPLEATRGRPVGLLWASPDCKHFSRAKGSKPVSKNIRSLAWVVVKWAMLVRPRVIILENVREFAEWGPVVPAWRCAGCRWRGTEGQAVLVRTRRRCPRCESRRLVETAELIPDPDRKGLTFKRWVGRLRNLGYAVEWKNLNAADFGAPTHRRRLFLVARCDGAPIAWPEPTHGDPVKIDAMPLFDRLKPWRTAAECIDWSLPCPSIFDRKKPLVEATLRRIAMGVKRYVLDNPRPFLVPVTHSGERRPHAIDEPLPTITSAHRGELAVVSPYLVRYNTEKSQGDNRAQGVEQPITTLDTQNRFGLVAAFMAKHFGGMVGVPIDTPQPTITATPTQNQLVAANLIHLNHGDKQWSTVEEPARTLTSGKHAALVYSFLTKYFGTAIGQAVDRPLGTQTTNDRFGVVTVTIEGEPYAIVDIGMRMLTPRELARAQGFPDDYVLTGTKTSQVARIGNSVPPVMAKVLVEANFSRQFAGVEP